MRYLIVVAAALSVTACATHEAAKKADTAPAAKTPQCWSADHNKFFDVGAKATISGVEVSCEKTSDGKSGQWLGKKH